VVIQAIETRALFTLTCQGSVLHGTYHVPTANFAKPNRIGILILSGFPMPRTAHGDVAVYWAASFADNGYPSFRIDLPGLGDSHGDVPAELLPFISAGGFGPIVGSVVKQLVERYDLTGIVMLGNCAGAISAIFGAAISKECKGLIVLDPPFHLPPAGRPTVRKVLFNWTTRSRFGGILSNIYDQLRNIRLLLRKNAPPKNANFPLLKRWKDLASGGMPILLLNAPEPKAHGSKPRVGKFDYPKYLLKLAGSRSRVDSRVIDNASHSFSNPAGRIRVRLHVEQWMPTFFPFEDPGQKADDITQSEHSNNEAAFANHESMFVPVDANLRG
jgi:pimeloyl-ACP methyl ester carboxylesterase